MLLGTENESEVTGGTLDRNTHLPSNVTAVPWTSWMSQQERPTLMMIQERTRPQRKI
ncbi:unnamed protein product [Timema podura]|uniref:Uncharacterized protein n=1 Tax=Timema podura TaxID=61482 RepID=A0ABN7P8Y7_TIMPD|nr:unnamed protein product [Timema podura]